MGGMKAEEKGEGGGELWGWIFRQKGLVNGETGKNFSSNVFQPFLENINRRSRLNRTVNIWQPLSIRRRFHKDFQAGAARLLWEEWQRNGAPISMCTIKAHWTHINILLHASQLLFHRLLTSCWRWTNVNNVSSKIPVHCFWLWYLTVPHFSVLHGKCTVQKLLIFTQNSFREFDTHLGVREALYFEYNAIFDFSLTNFFPIPRIFYAASLTRLFW